MAAPVLPSSLSPHICILTSTDLNELLKHSSLPPLHHILQSFSPLPQVTTRTTALVSVPHASFALRFSDLQDVEEACREDDEERAIRTLDWMTSRINDRCARWVHDVESLGDKENTRTPWWDELRRCTEGDFVPSKTEGWNHPIALILAVSTTAANPLQAITALHSRANQFPPWVDTNFLRYTLIIHPQNSPLSGEEAGALYNAVKKQFGLHSYLLSLELPETSPPPVPVPALMPRLPPPPLLLQGSPPQKQSTTSNVPQSPQTSSNPNVLNTLKMQENDIQQTARFTREFVVMSLVPWMEKCVVEWNENFASTRRLPSRLFSSTRRLFGSQAPSPVPSPQPSASVSSLPARSSVSLNGGPTPPSEQRRLAEFATILGDSKLAITVWETLRKDNKGGSDILPLLLSPTPVLPMFAQAHLTTIHPNMSDLPPHAQMRALSCAVRWEAGVPYFLHNAVEGERWLVWAASNSEEAPSALLLAQAALLSAKRNTRRRAALWYVAAATRLEKCGIKPLTMHFLRKAQDLYSIRSPKELSPSFWDSEGKSPSSAEGLEDIISGISHPLGRLMYTTGDLAGAVKLFLGLLKGTSSLPGSYTLGDGIVKPPSNDKLFLDDFRVAYNYWKSTEPNKISGANLMVPLKLCNSKQSRLRFPGDSVDCDSEIWSRRQDDWKAFWRTRGGKDSVVPSGKVSTNEFFWVDLVMYNPLDAEINLSNITLVVQEQNQTQTVPIDTFVEVEIIKEVTLGPKELISILVSLRSKRPTTICVTGAKYDFLGLLSTTESLKCRGRRLHDTPLQRQHPTYAPDVVMQVEVVPSDHRLLVTCVEDGDFVLFHGQNKPIRLGLTNTGSQPIGEVWVVSGEEDEIWFGSDSEHIRCKSETEIIQSSNSLKSQEPRRLTLNCPLQPGESLEVPALLHTESPGGHDLCLLFVFRENDTQRFHSTTLTRSYQVQPLLKISINADPSQTMDHSFVIDVDMVNVHQASAINISQLSFISPQWTCSSLTQKAIGSMTPGQCSHFLLGAYRWTEGSGSEETLQFVSNKLNAVLKSMEPDTLCVRPIDLQCSHISQTPDNVSMKGPATMSFIHSGRLKFMSRNISQQHPYIDPSIHSSIFPLYNPSAVDLLVFWEIPSLVISGHCIVSGITLGAAHARLDDIIEEAESTKVKRSMYAETRRENMEVLDAIRHCEWNAEMDPVVLSLADGGTKTHDFTIGPCHISLEIRLRNHSSTHTAQYILRLRPKPSRSTNLLPPPYTGRTTFRGTIAPGGMSTIHPMLWVTRSGVYSLGGWSLESEVFISQQDQDQITKKRRYLQEPSPKDHEPCIIVCDAVSP